MKRLIGWYKLPTPRSVAEQDLHNAQLDLLRAQQQREYWQAMETMLEERVDRLKQITGTDNT